MVTEQDAFDEELVRKVSQAVFAVIGQFLTPDTEWDKTKPIIAGIVDALARTIAMPISVLQESTRKDMTKLAVEIVRDQLRSSIPDYVDFVRKEMRKATN